MRIFIPVEISFMNILCSFKLTSLPLLTVSSRSDRIVMSWSPFVEVMTVENPACRPTIKEKGCQEIRQHSLLIECSHITLPRGVEKKTPQYSLYLNILFNLHVHFSIFNGYWLYKYRWDYSLSAIDLRRSPPEHEECRLGLPVLYSELRGCSLRFNISGTWR